MYVAKCLIKYGNCYLEVIRKKNGEISRLLPIPTNTIAKIK
nr:MAG TPA: portal protein [Bacteriophage sp.]